MLSVRQKLLLAMPALLLLYVWGLARTGLLLPDEPRYAFIGRAMAQSGDWITPRLWGEPWFEKPALLYWLIGGAYALGVQEDWAPRLPVAAVSVAFLFFFHVRLLREFGGPAAWSASVLLATSAWWVAFSQLGVTDLPLAALFSASVLLALPWLHRGETQLLPWAGACLGGAVLAKGLVPFVLVLPVVWFGRRRWRDVWIPALTCLVVALPWYGLCTWRNGWPFLEDFFGKHHFARFANNSLQHQQPWWFYLPVLLGAIFPWSALLAHLRPALWRDDVRVRVLAVTCLFGFIFFSAAANKLPGYLLPLLPSLCAVLGIAWSADRARWPLLVSGALLGFGWLAVDLLPGALAIGLTNTPLLRPLWWYFVPPAALCVLLFWLRQRMHLLLAVAALTVCGIVYIKARVYPILDRRISARVMSRQIAGAPEQYCLDSVPRALRYGLRFYSPVPIRDCQDIPRPRHVTYDRETGLYETSSHQGIQ